MKTLFLTLFLPLGLLLMGILAAGIWELRVAKRGRVYGGWQGNAKAFFLLGVFLIGWMLSMPAMGSTLGEMLLGQVKGRILSEDAQPDALVVLTAGMVNSGPGVGWLPKPQSISRVAMAYDLQRRINLRLPVIISGGYTEGVQAPSEARVVAEFFARHRSEVLPTELEEVSTDTYESALQLAPVLAKRGVKNVLLVTGDAHMLRALAAFRARGIDAIPLPVSALPRGNGIEFYLPSVYGLALTTDALYEVYALLFYLLGGKINLSDITYNQ